VSAQFRHFESLEDSFSAMYEVLVAEIIGSDHDTPYGIMLSGGSTPSKIYSDLSKADLKANSQMTLLFSDDRHLSEDSPDSNFGNCLPMIHNIDLKEDHVIHVDASLDLDSAAIKYAREIDLFKSAGGQISLALLGMGADGHTASIFTKDAAEIRDRSAFAVYNTGGFNRVSVSTPILESCERIIILVTGESKKEILQDFKKDPLSLPSGIATSGHDNIEIWTDIPASDL
jgi:6-phosphogluconolactonase